MSLYKDVLVTAWRQTINRPGLWLFGLFAAFVFGTAGEIDRYWRFMSAIVENDDVLNPVFWLSQHWVGFFKNSMYLLAVGAWQTWLFVVLLAIALVVILIMVSIAAGALIAASQKPMTHFAEAFAAGKKHWVDLFFLFVGGYVVVAGGTFGFGAFIFSLGFDQVQAQQVLVMLSSLVFVPLVIVCSFVVRYAANAIVLDNTHIFTALRRSAVLLRQHWLVTLEMSLLNFLVVFVANIVVFICVGLLFVPLYGTTMSMYTNTVLDHLLSTAMIHGVVYLTVTVFVGAILSTWQWLAWGLLFQRLRNEKPQSTLLRWLHYKRMTAKR